MMDRARYLRDSGYTLAARQLFARQHNFTHKPADVDRFLDMMALLAKEAASDRQWQLAYDIARQVDDAFGPGADISLKDYGIRDKYTTLTWTAGTVALERMNRARDSISMFDKYAGAGRSLQVKTKGWYWAGRASSQSGDALRGRSYFERAAATPELFYGQLALERLGRIVPAPSGTPSLAVTDAQRQAFNQKRLVRAVRLLGQQRLYSEQSLFVRALSENLDSDAERMLAVDTECRQCLLLQGDLPYPLVQRPIRTQLVAGSRDYSPGIEFRQVSCQPCRRARHDAANARHCPRTGRQNGAWL
jgi:soluble lytic murein transglycosylase